MTNEEYQQVIEHARALAKILYKNTPSEQLTSLAKIEEVVRTQMQEYVMPEVGVFLSKMPLEKAVDTNDASKASLENYQLPVLKRKS